MFATLASSIMMANLQVISQNKFLSAPWTTHPQSCGFLEGHDPVIGCSPITGPLLIYLADVSDTMEVSKGIPFHIPAPVGSP
jgi:hypothetical protein